MLILHYIIILETECI